MLEAEWPGWTTRQPPVAGTDDLGLVQDVLSHCGPELSALERDTDKLKKVSPPSPAWITGSDQLLQKEDTPSSGQRLGPRRRRAGQPFDKPCSC